MARDDLILSRCGDRTNDDLRDELCITAELCICHRPTEEKRREGIIFALFAVTKCAVQYIQYAQPKCARLIPLSTESTFQSCK